MIYDYIFVDSSNLFYRLVKDSKTSLDVIKKMINYIDREVKSHLSEKGEIYLLFDPIRYSDLGESKTFYHSLNKRKEILPDYKKGRIHSPLFLECIELFRKYYLYRGDKIKLYYSEEHEADDFVLPLLERIKESKIAIVSTDYDLASYITDSVHLINGSFNKPFTVAEFEKLFEFKPTIAANIMFKVFFGDTSDNIQGILSIKKAKYPSNIKELCRNYLQDIASKNISLKEILEQFNKASFQEINKKKEKDSFDLLFLSFSIVDLKVPVFEKLYSSIKIIRSSLEERDLNKYEHFNPINNSINDVIHKSIFGIPFSKSFGKL